MKKRYKKIMNIATSIIALSALVLSIRNCQSVYEVQNYQQMYESYQVKQQNQQDPQVIDARLRAWVDTQYSLESFMDIKAKGIGLEVGEGCIMGWKEIEAIESVQKVDAQTVALCVRVKTYLRQAPTAPLKTDSVVYTYWGTLEDKESQTWIERLEPAVRFNWGNEKNENTTWIDV